MRLGLEYGFASFRDECYRFLEARHGLGDFAGLGQKFRPEIKEPGHNEPVAGALIILPAALEGGEGSFKTLTFRRQGGLRHSTKGRPVWDTVEGRTGDRLTITHLGFTVIP